MLFSLFHLEYQSKLDCLPKCLSDCFASFFISTSCKYLYKLTALEYGFLVTAKVSPNGTFSDSKSLGVACDNSCGDQISFPCLKIYALILLPAVFGMCTNV